MAEAETLYWKTTRPWNKVGPSMTLLGGIPINTAVILDFSIRKWAFV